MRQILFHSIQTNNSPDQLNNDLCTIFRHFPFRCSHFFLTHRLLRRKLFLPPYLILVCELIFYIQIEYTLLLNFTST